MSCNLRPCGPLRAMSASAVPRIRRFASSGVRRTRRVGVFIFSEAFKFHVDNFVSIDALFKPSHHRRCVMAQTVSTRLHPIVALRAVRALTRNREDTRQVFLLMEALRGKTTLRQFARFTASEDGRAMLAERRSLLARLSDRASLAALPV